MRTPSLPVRDAAAARGLPAEPAQLPSRRTLEDLLGVLRDSFILDGVDEYLERILGWGAPPVSPAESRTIVPRLHDSLWWLVTEILTRTDGRPGEELIASIGLAARLSAEEAADGRTPDTVHARRLALLVSALLDEVADDGDDGPLPHFGADENFGWFA